MSIELEALLRNVMWLMRERGARVMGTASWTHSREDCCFIFGRV
jgi:hypothetical protein